MSQGDSASKFGYQHGDKVIPGYRLEELLGAGNFGEVWRATGPGRVKAAIKILDLSGLPGKVERRALDRIRDIVHPNLVSIFGIWSINRDGIVVDENTSSSTFSPVNLSASATVAHEPAKLDSATRMAIAMQLGSMSLFARLAECQAEGKAGIPKQELLGYMRDAAYGIDYLNRPIHDLGRGPVSIVHGDIKPQNLLLVGGGVQVCDYSLIRPVDDLQKTAMGGNCSPAYAAPELHVNKPCVTSDQYCLAMSYVELRTGTLPFPPDTSLTDLFYVKYEKRLVFSGMAPQVVEVLRKATDPDTENRFSSCSEMVEALREAESLHETKPHWFPPKIKWSGKTWKRVSVGVFAVAALAAAGLWHIYGPKPPQPAREMLDQLISQGQFAQAFEKTVTLHSAGVDSDRQLFDYVLSQWKDKVAALGQKQKFADATEVLISPGAARLDDEEAAKRVRDTRAELWDKELKGDWLLFLASKPPEELRGQSDLLDDLDKKYGEKDGSAKESFAKWRSLLTGKIRDAYSNLASTPELFTADKVGALVSTTLLSKEERSQIIDELRASVSDRFTDSLIYPFDTSDQILANGEEIAKRYPDVYNLLDFKLKEKKSQRFRAEFKYDRSAGNLGSALHLIEDRSKEWPEKPQDASDLAQTWSKDLNDRLTNEATIASDTKLVGDCGAFLRSFAKEPAAPLVRLIRARAIIRAGGVPSEDDWKQLTVGASGKQSLLLLELQLIWQKPAGGSKESKDLLNDIAKLRGSSGVSAQEETQQMLPWEKERYQERIDEITRPPVLTVNPIKTLDDNIARADLTTVDALVGSARAQIQKNSDAGQRNAWNKEFEPRDKIAGLTQERKRDEALVALDGISNRQSKENWRHFIEKVVPPEPTGPTIVVPSLPGVLARLLADAIAEFGKGDLQAAGEKLAEIEKQSPDLPAGDRAFWASNVNLWKSMIVLAGPRPPGMRLAEIRQALKTVPEAKWFLGKNMAGNVPLICKRLAVVAQCDDNQLIDDALALVWGLSKTFPSKETEILPYLAELFQKRIHLLVRNEVPTSGASDSSDQFNRLEEIWQEAKGYCKGDALQECNAWDIEYHMVLLPDNSDTVDAESNAANLLPPKSSGYVSYVRAFAFHENRKEDWRLSRQQWDAYLGDLDDTLAFSAKDASSLRGKRPGNVQQWSAEAVKKLCGQSGLSSDKLQIDLPQASSALIHALLVKHQPDRAKLEDDLRVPLAFTALYDAPIDYRPAEELLAAVVRLPDPAERYKRARAVLPLLFAYVQRRLDPKSNTPLATNDKNAVLRCGSTLLRTVQKSRANHLPGAEASLIAKRVLDPALLLAAKVSGEEATGSAGDRSTASLNAAVADFCEAAYDFSAGFATLNVPDYAGPDTLAKRRADMLDAAIAAARRAVHP